MWRAGCRSGLSLGWERGTGVQQAQAEGERWSRNNDINVCQIKWLVNSPLTGLTSELLLPIDQPAALEAL